MMNSFTPYGTSIYVHPSVRLGKNVKIGHGSCIGFGEPDGTEIVIGDDVIIGAYCVIHFDVKIGSGCMLDHYCRISEEVEIGKNTRLLYGKHIYESVRIGENCIIGGHVADRTVIQDNVTYMGEIAHSHRDPTLDWDENVEPSPIIYKGSFVGVNAILVGGIKVGPSAYIAAGEIARTDVPEGQLLYQGELKNLSEMRGMFKTRC
ncbi:DapH/DapD/GlmU-related protein [Sediminibacterium sp.]|uniref:DapH/DapD/GlmU-related protein n=1 Tax=Sediminibacterium sp. TaxID=1917865 RepID=UPI0025DA049F|nr:DapH/DapD/GlmU-related protein [Sediminibacterium sp.]